MGGEPRSEPELDHDSEEIRGRMSCGIVASASSVGVLPDPGSNQTAVGTAKIDEDAEGNKQTRSVD